MNVVATMRRRGLSTPWAALTAVTVGLAVLQPFVWAWVRTGVQRVWEERSRADQVVELQRRYAQVQQAAEQQPLLNQLAAIVLGSQDTLHVLERLESVAQRAGVQVKIVSIHEAALAATRAPGDIAVQATPAPSMGGLSSLVVTVAAAGEPGRLLEYLAAVEHLPELTQIRTLTLRPFEGEAAPAQPFEMSFDVIFYVQQQTENRES